ncbi:MAG: hypothetical protein RMI91_00545 [Gemmatales bacterium]|nr:hypothetical protein [Gemmatales bacterium]MDW7993120.1 hypothetical protein [Gemmatales bacterium]
MVRLLNGRWLAAGRMFQNGQPRTVLSELDVRQGRLIPVLTAPSGDDTSYPGLVWHDGKLYVSYYRSHEGKSAAHLAVVRVP